jgi:NADH-quinone oxidoreductase subunit H
MFGLELVSITILFLVCFVSLLISVAFLTLLERKFIASIQNRKGPNKVGFLGILQPFADALKLITKEIIYPRPSKNFLFLVSPILSFFFSLLVWMVIPIGYFSLISGINLAFFFIFVVSVLHVYGIFLAGWASGSRYSFLGGIRSSAQLIAYDINIGLVMICLVLFTENLTLIRFVELQEFGFLFFYFFPLFFIMFVCSLAETNRHPFDLPEAEAELVAGYFTEYSSTRFALFFLGEYCSILAMSNILVIMFLGGWLKFFCFYGVFAYGIKVLFIYYLFLLARTVLPRYRYDQLMRMGWKYIMPIMVALFFFFCIIKLLNIY